jgi:hypothetical protein
MSSSRNTIKNLMRRLNVLPEIPEERVGIDGRPVSQMLQKDKSEEKIGSIKTTISEVPTMATHTDTCPDENIDKGNMAQHSPQAGDLLFIPQDVKAPTNFGPNNEYKAIPSVIEYSTTRGRSRVSIREATAEDLETQGLAGSTVPIISDIPAFSQPHKLESGLQAHAVPLISPPQNFKPIHVKHSPLNPTNRISASDQSIRTSTTSIRTSTASTLDHATRNSTATEDENAAFSDTVTLNSSDSASQRVAAAPAKHRESYYSEKPPYSAGSWPVSRANSNGSMRSRTTAQAVPGSQGAPSSRFSWNLSKTERTKNWFTRWFIEWWALEILSWFFSAICMMIIAIVLWKVDGKSIPDWKLGVSTNAFISIFSGFAKSALLLPTAEALGQLKWIWFRKERKMMDFEVLDSASRGAWGSMILLGKTKGM